METTTIDCSKCGEVVVKSELYEKFGCPVCYVENKKKSAKETDEPNWSFKTTHYSSEEGDKRRFVSDATRDKMSVAQTLPQTAVIQSFRAVHGDRYDYSKVVYTSNRNKVIIICPEHGEFLQSPNSHSKGQGCPVCARLKRQVPLDTLLKQFRAVHGDKYDYSKVVYAGNRNKVIIICPEHGEFLQRPNGHKKGNGCPKCLPSGRKRKSQEEVVAQFQKVHGDRYDYSKVKYVGAETKVIIICPEHGEFLQVPNSHIKGQGCPVCGRLKRTKPLDTVLEQFRAVHGDKYDYSKVKYVHKATKVIIICSEHGEFLQSPNQHMKGQGCPKCARLKSRVPLDTVLEQFRAVHGDRYDYSKVVYAGNRNKVIIICPEHGEFLQLPSTHKRGLGCRKCGNRRKGRVKK